MAQTSMSIISNLPNHLDDHHASVRMELVLFDMPLDDVHGVF